MLDDEGVILEKIISKGVKSAYKDQDDNLVIILNDETEVNVNYCCYGGVSVYEQKGGNS